MKKHATEKNLIEAACEAEHSELKTKRVIHAMLLMLAMQYISREEIINSKVCFIVAF